jgi:hypothetical protein
MAVILVMWAVAHSALVGAATLSPMVTCLLLAGASYALFASLAQALGPRRPD